MVLLRALGWLLLVLAVAAAAGDWLAWQSQGAVRLLALGDLWSRLDFSSLNFVHTVIEGHISAKIWSWIAMSILKLPALPVFLIGGAIFLHLARRGRAR